MLVGLALVQAAGLTIHAYDRVELQHEDELRNVGIRAMGIYRSVVATSVSERQAALQDLDLGAGVTASLSPTPPLDPPELTPQPDVGTIRANMTLVPLRQPNRPIDIMMRGAPWDGTVTIGYRLPDEGWLVLHMPVPRPSPWKSPTFLPAFGLMTAVAAVLCFWAVRRLTGPVATLAEAAERLGRDVNATPLPEGGPDEVARAAVAFNTMASRIRRFVQDRTFLLTAIGHDLRTPITRLKLRAEFIDDDELRDKFLADLDDAGHDGFGHAGVRAGHRRHRTGRATGPGRAAAHRAGRTGRCAARMPPSAWSIAAPEHLTVHGRPVSLKRAFANLIGNAVKYGGAARVALAAPETGAATVVVGR